MTVNDLGVIRRHSDVAQLYRCFIVVVYEGDGEEEERRISRMVDLSNIDIELRSSPVRFTLHS